MTKKNNKGKSKWGRAGDLLTLVVLVIVGGILFKHAAISFFYDNFGVGIPVYKPAIEAKAGDGKSLKIATYNVLIDPVALERRETPLFRVLEATHADIIALQEVGTAHAWFMQRLAKEEWAKSYYKVGDEPDQCNGQLILSKLPAENGICFGLPGFQSARTVLIATIKTPAGPLKVATSHMESPLGAGTVRIRQLNKIFSELGSDGDALFMGDFNFGDKDPEVSRIDPSYTDVWKALHPKEPGYTWDNEKSELANSTKFPGEPSRRLDRMLLRSRTWEPESMQIIGDAPTNPPKRDMFPSDHFGLYGVLKLR